MEAELLYTQVAFWKGVGLASMLFLALVTIAWVGGLALRAAVGQRIHDERAARGSIRLDGPTQINPRRSA